MYISEPNQLLELTASQELVLKEDIGSLLNTPVTQKNTPVTQNLHVPWNPQFNYDMFQDQSNKPIFYFQNSTVNFFGSGGPH